MGNVKAVLLFVLYLVIACLFTYGVYWVLKYGSYVFFYQAMVQETIREMVKPEFLIK